MASQATWWAWSKRDIATTFILKSCRKKGKNATFYQKHGFSIMEDGAAMQIRNPGERR